MQHFIISNAHPSNRTQRNECCRFNILSQDKLDLGFLPCKMKGLGDVLLAGARVLPVHVLIELIKSLIPTLD